MTFTYLGADLSEIISKFTYANNNYHIEYLDGSEVDYYNDDPDHSKQIKSLMIEQALKRHRMMESDRNRGLEDVAKFGQFVSVVAIIAAINDQSIPAAGLFTMSFLWMTCIASDKKRKRKELEKYGMFFDMKDNLDTINSPEYMEEIEPEHIYQRELDIDSIDDFTHAEVKILYRKLKQEKN